MKKKKNNCTVLIKYLCSGFYECKFYEPEKNFLHCKFTGFRFNLEQKFLCENQNAQFEAMKEMMK